METCLCDCCTWPICSHISKSFEKSLIRSGCQEVFCKKSVLKNLQNSQENTCIGVSFLIKLQTWDFQLYWKRDSGTGIFQWILQSFWETFFYRTPPVTACNYWNSVHIWDFKCTYANVASLKLFHDFRHERVKLLCQR